MQRDELSPDPGLPRGVSIAVAGFLAILWGILAPVPFLSEDWTQMEQLGRVPTFLGALDPAREPLRPLQHAFLWALAHCGVDPATWLPTAARAFAFVLQGLACWAVVGLARRAGLGVRGVAIALLLFAVFPNVKMLSWPAAIGSPGRVAFELLALLYLARRAGGGSARDGWIGLAALAVALGFHESAFLLPAILLAWIACIGTESLASGMRRALAGLRDPFVLGACALGAFHLVHLLFFRPGRVHGAKDLAALPANFVKAALALAPEALREIGVEGLRGNRGTVGIAAACIVLVVVAIVALLALRRGGLARFAVAAVAIDLGLAVAGAGFVQRYACLASAFAALALARLANTGRRAAVATVALLGLLWAGDSVQDALEIRAAGRSALALAAEARRVHDGGPLGIVGVPDMVGAEEDVPYFNWGGASFLRAHGVPAPVELLRERRFRTNSDQELVDAARLRELEAAGVDLWRWPALDSPLVSYPP
ncbi:MAG: hypothetical protein NTY35_17725 [Planctomycetota bacterium]|nr:hypothetical protein [Planctomycetota bacterium]